MGSLNGSVLNGMIISTSDRRPGEQHVLADQDVLEVGGVSKIRITCGSPPAQPSKRRAGMRGCSRRVAESGAITEGLGLLIPSRLIRRTAGRMPWAAGSNLPRA